MFPRMWEYSWQINIASFGDHRKRFRRISTSDFFNNFQNYPQKSSVPARASVYCWCVNICLVRINYPLELMWNKWGLIINLDTMDDWRKTDVSSSNFRIHFWITAGNCTLPAVISYNISSQCDEGWCHISRISFQTPMSRGPCQTERCRRLCVPHLVINDRL